MGLPVGKLICASNANNVLSEFLESGVYRIDDRSLVKTPSPSMDILIASNIERFLYEITKDPKQVGSWTKQLKEKKRFGIGNKNLKKIARLFSNGWKNNEQTLKIIKDVYINFGYLPDPHTAVALGVADNYKKRSKNKVVVLSTAHWAKFVKDVYAAIFKNANKNMDEKGLIKKMAGAVNQPKIPSAFTEIFSRKKKFDTTVDANTDTTIRVIDKFIL
jgi:threonine synthase